MKDQFSQERHLKFPTDRIVGRVYVQKYSKALNWSRWSVVSPTSPWRLLGPATGDVRVPPHHVVLLVTSLPAVGDLRFLAMPSNKALDALQVYAPESGRSVFQPLAELSGLRLLTISAGSLDNASFSTLENLESLDVLHLGTATPCKLSAPDLLGPLSQIPDITSLRLHNIHLEGASAHSLERLDDVSLSFDPQSPKEWQPDGLRWLGQAPALKSLRIRAQDIEGQTLHHLDSAHLLETLELEEVILDHNLGHILGGLTNLRTLRLDNVVFWGGSMQFLARLEALQALELHTESLHESDLAMIASVANLRTLSLPYTTLYGRVDQLAAATNLSGLELPGAGFDPDTFTGLSALASLETFDVSDTDCTDATLQFLAGRQSLRVLRLGGCQSVTELGLSRLRSHSGLEELDLSDIAGHGKLLSTFAGCEALETLLLRGLQVGPEIGMISHISTLRELTLDDAVLLPGTLKMVSSISSLEYLSLSGASIPESDLRDLATLKNLQELRLPAITLVQDWISTLPSLEALTLSHTVVDEKHWSVLGRCPSLRKLTLFKTSIASDLNAGGLVPDRLEQIYLPHTKLHGSSLTNRLRLIPALRLLDLSGSDAEPDDLKAISGHPALRHLGLSGIACSPEELASLDLPNLDSFSGLYIAHDHYLLLRLWELLPWCWSSYRMLFR